MLTDEDKQDIEETITEAKQHIDALHNFELHRWMIISMMGTLSILFMKLVIVIFSMIIRIDPAIPKENRKLGIEKCKELYKYC